VNKHLQPIEVSAEQERGFALHRHRLLGDSASACPERVAESMVGLHAARLSSPWVAMRARADTFETEQLRRPLIEAERSLIKLRCMRRTLHILPLHLAPIAHLATLDQRLGACRASLRRLGRSERALKSVTARVREHLSGQTEPYRVLEQAILRRRTRDAELVRLAIKWLWELGELVYLDLSPSLHHERRAFALTAEALPGLQLNAYSIGQARQQLVMAYIRAFGPVSVRDIAWWSGMGGGQVLRALSGSREELAALRCAEPVPSDHLSLLGYEDPALKGYFETRARYVSATGYPTLFNTIGEARASVMYRGRVVGIWAWDRRLKAIEAHTFEPLPLRAHRALNHRLDDMECFLRNETLAV
jgi:hypothetical protein